MRKFSGTVYIILMAALVLSLSGCGSSSSNLGSDSSTTVQQVAVISSPALEKGGSYQIYRGAAFNNIGDAKYFIAPGGSEANKAGMNLGLKKALESDESLAIVKNGTKEVVYAYNPSGTDDAALSSGTVTISGGTLLSYSGHGIYSVSPSFFTAMAVDTTSAKTITLNGNTATFDGSAVESFDYVWHVSPDHRDEYYTLGINGTTEYTEDKVLEAIGNKTVYIAHDIRYMPNYLNFTKEIKDDDETEYAAYYSKNVSEEVYAELGEGFSGPFIFATLPQSGTAAAPGQGGNGQEPGTPPDQNNDNGQGNGTPPEGGNGNGQDGQQRPGQGGVQPGMSAPRGQMPGQGTPGGNIRSSASNSEIAYFSTMTHSPSDAYDNPVLHITEAGTYRLTGTWNGQIWIDAGDDDDETAKVTVILDNVTVTCGVAPAIVFYKLYECGPNTSADVAANDTWKEVGKDFGKLGKDLGASIVKSVKKGVKKASDWADDDQKEEPKADVVIEPEQKNE